MDGLLTPISTQRFTKSDDRNEQHHAVASRATGEQWTAEDVANILGDKPDLRTLTSTLKRLSDASTELSFSIYGTDAKVSRIVFLLVDIVIRDFWPILKAEENAEARHCCKYLLNCLKSVTGCSAIVASLRDKIVALGHASGEMKAKSEAECEIIANLIDVLERVLDHKFIHDVRARLRKENFTSEKHTLQWKEAIALFASGKILSIVAEAGHVLNRISSQVERSSWIEQGLQYTAWLGDSISEIFTHHSDPDSDKFFYQDIKRLMTTALSLGYPDILLKTCCSSILAGDTAYLHRYKQTLQGLDLPAQRGFLYSMVRILAQKIQSGPDLALESSAALLSTLISDHRVLADILLSWLTGSSAEAFGSDKEARRLVVLTLSPNLDMITGAFWKVLEQFRDRLVIKHSPILHQQVTTEILMLLAGHAYRQDQTFLIKVSKSSAYLNSISNHLAASSPSSRFLGMVFGASISKKVDESGKQLKFAAEDHDSSDDWKWYSGLIDVHDYIGKMSDLAACTPSKSLVRTPMSKRNKEPSLSTDLKGSKKTMPSSRAPKIVEIKTIEEIGSSDDDDDLPTYAKPDSDHSDSEDDPTLVQRNKPSPPVYIRDLLVGLRETEEYDKHTLALEHAADLIRRKVTFGTEISDHIDDLASTLVGLKDRWELPDFTKWRLRGMLAVLISDPARMGLWFGTAFYTGDYSLGQRISILTTLGMGAREIAGESDIDTKEVKAQADDSLFASKRLPDKLHKLYVGEAGPTNQVAAKLEQSMIQPLAASAADQVTGPAALKIRTFSSRMDVEKRKPKPASNALANVVANSFFYPLVGRWQIQIRTMGNEAPQSSPMLLSHLLKTLSLILHAAGPSAIVLPQLTAEHWSFLLHIRTSARAEDPIVLESLIFSFLSLLEVNRDRQRQIAEHHPKELIETQEWANHLLEKIRGGEAEGERSRMLIAALLIRCREIIEKYQRLLMGDLVDFI